VTSRPTSPRAEMGAHGALHGVTMRTHASVRGRLELAEVARLIAPNAGPYLVSTKAVSVENTHNFGGGTIQDFDTLSAVADLCREHGLGYHLDGARLWNAHVATGIALAGLRAAVRHRQRRFSKGLGRRSAPCWSARRSGWRRPGVAQAARRRMRQAGILAAGRRTRWTTTWTGSPTTTRRVRLRRGGGRARPRPRSTPCAVPYQHRGAGHRFVAASTLARRPRSRA
jgi:hypothetical protein